MGALDILNAVWVLGAISAVCAVLLVLADKFMQVPVDEKFPIVRDCLPGANCGACGYAGCDGYASALVSGEETRINKCVPGADGVAMALSQALGVEFEDVEEQVAFVCCGGDCNSTSDKMAYQGISTCAAAKSMYGGKGACSFGCLGFGDCASVCPQEAICLFDGLARVDASKCIGCGLCAKTCPSGIIAMLPAVSELVVRCSNREKGAATRKECSNGCIGCHKCEKECPEGAITVVDNLARIDQAKCTACGRCAQVCPVGCIDTRNAVLSKKAV